MPPGWAPSPGWTSPADWPAPPADWQFWVPTQRPSWVSQHKGLTAALAGGGGVLLIIMFVAAALSAPPSKPASRAADPTVSTAPPTKAPAAPASPTPAAKPTPPPPAPKPKALTYSGRGSKLLKISKGADPMIVTITGRGSSNFAVLSLDSSGAEMDLLVNEIGSYTGTKLIDAVEGEQTAALKITGTGFTWTVVLKPLSMGRVWTGSGTLGGRGDEVVIMPSEPFGGLDAARITHTGKSNFAVYAFAENRELLINEIGRYSGEVQVPSGTSILTFDADGPWTIVKI